jgi:hypothetical protein
MKSKTTKRRQSIMACDTLFPLYIKDFELLPANFDLVIRQVLFEPESKGELPYLDNLIEAVSLYLRQKFFNFDFQQLEYLKKYKQETDTRISTLDNETKILWCTDKLLADSGWFLQAGKEPEFFNTRHRVLNYIRNHLAERLLSKCKQCTAFKDRLCKSLSLLRQFHGDKVFEAYKSEIEAFLDEKLECQNDETAYAIYGRLFKADWYRLQMIEKPEYYALVDKQALKQLVPEDIDFDKVKVVRIFQRTPSAYGTVKIIIQIYISDDYCQINEYMQTTNTCMQY